MHIDVITLFPEMVEGVTKYGVTGRAVEKGLLSVGYQNPRDFSEDRHRTVDDRPYGGGPGMVMLYEPLNRAIDKACSGDSAVHVICLSPQGKPLDQATVERLLGYSHLVLVAGRYEGIDERLILDKVDEELSIGDYVLSGGELGAMVVIDAIARQIPGALGHEDSAGQDSFATGLLDCPHYTRPEEVAGQRVPEVLLSGDHAAIARWRLKQALGRTWLRRPDLLEQLNLDAEQQKLLKEFIEEYGNG